ncbi:amidohydrolase family protein [Cytobacillus purgationiresistens]|uniref:TIM-barrel fold metal-dependent hydrolase n=1 Tax=Cytobacillus purgationiresistens TaxID=863449 RepID=A0ABU0AK04_9BACI|nr:amidohydrolase family protein [Cytobacillus purgationiresistens]MDQ0271602.1 putative TIM-barrel fold metal-dependent hydrolase [Cytobacillus purgationiresistens]
MVKERIHIKVFDAHLHIIDQGFPLIPNQGYLPDYFSCEDYQNRVKDLEVAGGAIVSGSFQGFDQTYLREALSKLGRKFVGVAQLPHDTSDDEILRLHQIGVRAIRFNVKRGGSENISRLDYFARRVHEMVGWHTELYIDSKQLPDVATTIRTLPAVSIDHLGLSKQGFKELLSLVEKGVRVKATGFGRIDFDPSEALIEIYSVHPDALMFGTDLPSTRAKRPYHSSDIDIVIDALGKEKAEKVLYKNAMKWYMAEK